MTNSLDLAAAVVLCGYSALGDRRWCALGNAGGFSGARLWRVETTAGAFCLRAWPAATTPERLREIHGWLRLATEVGLEFVPGVLANAHGATWTEEASRLWELTRWLPGRADFHERRSAVRIEAACRALARLHRAWASLTVPASPCPAVRRRLDCYHAWTALIGTGWRPSWETPVPDLVTPWATRAWVAVQSHIRTIPDLLHPLSTRRVPLQPCLGDLWHDHVLFDGDTVTGLIDYGAARLDHVAVDLARLLGSLAGDESNLRAAGLTAYRRVRPLSPDEEALVTVLDRTGTILGAANWLLWLYREGRVFEDREGVARRLAALVERIENWPNV